MDDTKKDFKKKRLFNNKQAMFDIYFWFILNCHKKVGGMRLKYKQIK